MSNRNATKTNMMMCRMYAMYMMCMCCYARFKLLLREF